MRFRGSGIGALIILVVMGSCGPEAETPSASPCPPGYGDPSRGCTCKIMAAQDVPDVNHIDENCDGIDGDKNKAIFVDLLSGNDTNAGTPESPARTIKGGLLLAKNSKRTSIYVSKGTYTEKVDLVDGISIYGGYSATDGWEHNASYVVEISSPENVGVQGQDILSPVVLADLRIRSRDARLAGESSYGLHCTNCTGVALQRVQIVAGNGVDGVNGLVGEKGLDGMPGMPGILSPCRADPSTTTYNGLGGAGGTSVILSAGGNGGRGGFIDDAPNNGVGGSAGQPITPGGAGGTEGSPNGQPGLSGENGVAGYNGFPGLGFLGKVDANGFWVSANGYEGGMGSDGNGGGGGGGSSRLYVGGTFTGKYYAGAGGGGGGSGGQGGQSGKGGTGGGGSFGLFLLASDGFVVQDSLIQSAKAGNGGRGGDRGAGGVGGSGGNGGSGGIFDGMQCPAALGGNGGKGGDGGRGGAGGGGAGGPSYAIFVKQSNILCTGEQNTLLPGLAGKGGLGGSGTSSANGSDGMADVTNNANLDCR